MILNCLTAVAISAAAAVSGGCGGDSDAGSASGPAVSVGTTQLADIARNVAGQRATVDGILDANSDPHDYEPKPSDVEGVADADLILRSGGDPDLWLDQIIESSGSEAPVLTLLDRVDTVEESESGTDPHWWQNPRNAIIATACDPRRADRARSGRRARPTRPTQPPTSPSSRISTPRSRRASMRSPPSDASWSQATTPSITTPIAMESTSSAPPSQPSRRRLNPPPERRPSSSTRSARPGVSTIFPEAGVSAELESVIAEEAGATVGDELWADTLGPDGSDGATYIASLEANTIKLVDGFTDGEQTCSISTSGE